MHVLLKISVVNVVAGHYEMRRDVCRDLCRSDRRCVYTTALSVCSYFNVQRTDILSVVGREEPDYNDKLLVEPGALICTTLHV